jgi:hypothetical protein
MLQSEYRKCTVDRLVLRPRNNTDFGSLYGLERDLGLHGNQYQTAVSLLFVTYILSEVSIKVSRLAEWVDVNILQLPSNLVLKKFRPSRWISFIATCWGIVCALLMTDLDTC